MASKTPGTASRDKALPARRRYRERPLRMSDDTALPPAPLSYGRGDAPPQSL